MPQINFAQLGDPQMGLGSDSLQRDMERFSWVLAQCRELKCEFALSVGDLTNHGLEEEIKAYRTCVEKELLRGDGQLEVEVYNLAGNHDMQSGTGLKSYLAGFCSPPFKASPSYYSFVEPTTNVFFVVLNTMLLCSTVSDLQEERQAHWDWLRKQLDPTTTKSYSRVIASGHHPLFVLHEDESDTNDHPVPEAILTGTRRKWMTNLPDVEAPGGREIVERAVKDMSMISIPRRERKELIGLFKAAGVEHYLFGHTHNRIEVPATDASFVQYSATGTSMSLDYEQHPLNFRLWTIDNSDSSRSPKITNELVYLPRAMCPPLIPMEDIAKMGPRPVPPDGRVVKPGKEFLDRIEERRREILGSQMKF